MLNVTMSVVVCGRTKTRSWVIVKSPATISYIDIITSVEYHYAVPYRNSVCATSELVLVWQWNRYLAVLACLDRRGVDPLRAALSLEQVDMHLLI